MILHMNQLDSDLLRTFLAIIDAGSISAGAARIGRSQSAVSLQVKRLESILGKPVFERHGRGVIISATGEKLEPTARRAVSLLDRSLAEIKSDELAGVIRLGIPDDHSQIVLADIIAEFSKRHPLVELDVRCASGAGFRHAISGGTLDLAIYEVETVASYMEVLRDEKTFWVSSRFHTAHELEPLPVALFDRDCWWRDAALNTLRRSGLAYRVVLSSESVSGVAAAIKAGIAVGLLGQSSIDRGFRILKVPKAFTEMPTSKLVLERRKDLNSAVSEAMAAAIKRAFKVI